MTDNNRLIVAQLVSDKKNILFGALSPVLTRKDKEQCWENIRKEAIAGGCQHLKDKDWRYVRDGVWGPTRRDAIKKYDIAQRSGEGAVRYSQVDNVVLGIVGRDSSVIKGLNVNDTEEDLNLNLDEEKDEEESATGKDVELVGTVSAKSGGSGGMTPIGRSVFATYRTPKQNKPRSSPFMKRSSSSESMDEIDAEIKRNKLLLVKEQLKGQQLANTKMQLEIEEMRSRRSSGSSCGYAFDNFDSGRQQSSSAASQLQPVFRTQDEQIEWEQTRRMEDEELGRF